MKKLFLSLLAAFPLFATAQLANAGFEEWFFMPGAFQNRPTDWTWSDGLTRDPEHWFYAFPNEEAYEGDYALTLQVVAGDSKDMAVQHAPVNGRPQHFTGFYKYIWNTIGAPDGSSVSDIAQITVFMTRWDSDSSHRDTVGFAIRDIDSTADYTAFDLEINYLSQDDPDSAFVLLDPSMLNRIPQVQFSQPNGTSSFFTVDALSFDTDELGTHEQKKRLISVYPNPATEVVYFGDFEGTVTLRDAGGRILVDDQPVGQGKGIHIAGFPSGIYFPALSNNGTVFPGNPIIKQ